MSIRIPPKADPDTRDAFTDIEQELNELKSSITSIEDTPPVSLQSLQEEIATLNSKINDLSQFQNVSESFGTKTDGLPLRALHEDGNWREVIDGLVKAVPAELGGASKAQRVVNVLASLAVINGLSADSVRCRKLFAIRPSCYLYRLDAQAIANNTETDILWTHERYDNAGMHSTTSDTDRITITEGGLYLIGGHVHWESNGTGARYMFITLNDAAPSADPSRLLVEQKNAPDDAFGRVSGCTLYPLTTGDILRFSVEQVSTAELDTRAWLSPRDIGFWCTKVSD